jgi:hypothetical protein
MLTYFAKRLATQRTAFTFATAAYRDINDYYKVLEVESGATE